VGGFAQDRGIDFLFWGGGWGEGGGGGVPGGGGGGGGGGVRSRMKVSEPQHDHRTCWVDARTSSTHFVLHQIPIISRWVCRTNSATSPSIGESKNVLVCLKPVLFPLSYFDFLLIFSELFLWIAGNVYQLQIAVMFYLIKRLDPPWEKCWYWDLEYFGELPTIFLFLRIIFVLTIVFCQIKWWVPP